MVKVYNTEISNAKEALEKELQHYAGIAKGSLLSSIVPGMHTYGMFPQTAIPCLVLTLCEQQICDEDEKFSSKWHAGISKAKTTFHKESGCCHSRLHAGIVLEDAKNTIKIVNMASMAQASAKELQAEWWSFKKHYIYSRPPCDSRSL